MSYTTAGPISRRTMLRTAAAGTAGLAATSIPMAASAAPPRRNPSSPLEALERLRDGNERFVSGLIEEPRRDITRVQELADGQAPYAAILGCADSRVPVEILFDEGFGDIFTVRVAGNVATPEEIASLEYAVGVLGSKALVVLGHSECGAVAAARSGGSVPGQISALFSHISPALPAEATMAEAVDANVRHQVAVLRQSSTVIRDALASGSLALRGAVYGLDDGRVHFLD